MIPAMEAGTGILEAIAAHPSERKPEVVPVWARYDGASGHFRLDWSVLEGIRRAGMEPVIYAESQPMTPQGILAGEHDDAFRLLAARSRGAAIRIFHECNGGLFPWGKWPIPQMKNVFHYVGELFHAEGARLIYCVSARGKRGDDMLDRYPGGDVVDIVAFDEFRRSNSERLPPLQWAWTTQRLASTGKPVWVCETGAEAVTTNRGLWMASLKDVAGVAAILIFDFRIVFPHEGQTLVDDWRWNKAMIRQWNLLPA